MVHLSPSKKLNYVLNDTYERLMRMGIHEIRRYVREFKSERDYNIAQYGNLIIWYSDLRQLYKKAGYKSIKRMSDQQLWEAYKNQVRFVTNYILWKEEQI